MNHIAMYLPGLSDHKTGKAQAWTLHLWKIYGVNVIYHPMNWSDKHSFSQKLEGILSEIDRLCAAGHKISLIGTSAGASAVINIYARRPKDIHRVVCICGKLSNPQTIKDIIFIENPAFKESLTNLSESLALLSPAERSKILSLKPLADGVVPPADTIIKNAHSHLLPSMGHGFSIFYALTIGSWPIARFIKS